MKKISILKRKDVEEKNKSLNCRQRYSFVNWPHFSHRSLTLMVALSPFGDASDISELDLGPYVAKTNLALALFEVMIRALLHSPDTLDEVHFRKKSSDNFAFDEGRKSGLIFGAPLNVGMDLDGI